MKIFSIFLIMVMILSVNAYSRSCPADNTPESQVCIANMLNDAASEQLFTTLAIVGGIAGGVGYYLVNKKEIDEKEKQKMLEDFKSGNGIPIFKKGNLGLFYYKQNKSFNYTKDLTQDLSSINSPFIQILSLEYKLN